MGDGRAIGWLIGLVLAVASAGAAQAQNEPARRVPEGLKFANGLLRENRYDLAADEYEKFLKASPNGPEAAEAHFGLARARLFLNQYREARQHFEAYLRLAPEGTNAATAAFRIGETAYLLNELPAARTALESYTEKYPGHYLRESAWPDLGDVYYRQGDLPRARIAYQKGIEEYPDGRLANRSRYQLGLTLADLGEADEALKVLQDLARRGGSGWLDKASLQIARVQLKAGQPAEAIAALDALEKAAPRSPLIPESRLRRAEALLKLDRRDEAEAQLRALIGSASASVASGAAEVLGGSLWDRKQPAEALAVWDSALAKYPDSSLTPTLLSRSAEALVKLGRADEARSRLLKVVEGYPKSSWSPSALIRAARLALDGRDLATARMLAASFPRRFPNHALRADARWIEARAFQASGKTGLKNAIALYEALLAEDKPSPETRQATLLSLGQALRADGQEERADRVLRDLASGSSSPTSADARYLLGKSQFEARRYAQAITALESYFDQKPKGDTVAPALAYLVVARDAQGQADAAEADLARLAEMAPASKSLAWARLVLGESALAAEKFDAAAERVRPVAEGDDAEYKPRALSALGWALYRGGKPAEAAVAFGNLVSLAPKDAKAPEAALMLGRALEAAKKTDEALAAYAKVVADYPADERAGSAALARARLLADSGQPAEAAAAFAGYLKDHPEGGKAADETADAVLSEWAWALLDAKQDDDASAAFRRLIDEHSESPRAADARVFLAESAYRARDLDGASKLLEPVVAEGSKAGPESAEKALLRLGRIRADKEDWNGALAYLDRLLKEHADGPLATEARFWKAEAVFRSGDATAAEPHFVALAGDASEAAKPWVPIARLRHVQCLAALKKWKEALAEADALKSDQPRLPQMAELHYARGQALSSQAQFDDARDAFTAAIAARPESEIAARAQWMIGESYLHQRNYREALRAYHRVELSYPGVPRWQAAALLESGKTYELLDRWPDAAASYEKLLKQFGKTEHAAEATQRLDAARKRLARAGDEGREAK